MIMDLHNHTVYSYDGSNTPEEIIENAIRSGIEAVGICDHQFTIRRRLDEYIEHILQLKDKYSHKIKIYAGLEIGMAPRPDDLFSSETKGLDYVLFERLDKPNSTDLFEFLAWRHKFSCPVGLAHCDIFKMSEDYGVDMLKMMREENIFWELNTSGNYNYYYDFLTSAKKRDAVKRSGVGVSIGSDTHAVFEFRKKQILRANELCKELALALPFEMY